MEMNDDIILPPQDVREVIDKTAGYIVRNGASFEQRMKERQAQNKQFQFLFEHDAYYAYYRWKINAYKSGEEPKAENQTTTETTPDLSATPTASAGPEKPRDLIFHYSDLIPMSSFDFDVIKMTASLVAQNGEEYIWKLLEERADAVALDFLKEDHSLHKIFRHFVKQFKAVLEPPEELIKHVSDKAADPFSVLQDAYNRAEYDYRAERDQKAKQDEVTRQKLEYASIDWSNFVVVETIDIDEADKVSELPLPLNLADLQYRSLAQKKAHSLIEEAAPDEDMPAYDAADDSSEEEQEEQNQETVVPQAALPARPMRPVPKGMNIRPAGARSASPAAQTAERMVRSPFSNQMIPESKLKQHIDITFRDPRYAEEKKRYEAKVQNSNPQGTDDVLENIKSVLNRKRNTPAGETDEHSAKKSKVQWDGYRSSAKYVTQEANKHVSKKDIEDHKRRQRDEQNRIGPTR